MESAGEDLDNLFEDYESRGNDAVTNEGENNEVNNENTAGVMIQPPKRTVRRKNVVFNPERLIGERGIPVLLDHFKNVKFKGKGHEKEDLDKLLTRLEHWTHRLFPSMRFEDCLHRIEKLGTKRPVQTCLRKMRLGMPILSKDFIKDDEEDNVQRNEDTEPIEMDAFDKLIGESNNFNSCTASENMDSDSFHIDPSPMERNSYESRGHVLGSSGSSLTEEQKERLERNKLLAVERRKARLAALQQNNNDLALENNERPFVHDDPIAQSFDSLFEDRENNSDNIPMTDTHNNTIVQNENISLKPGNPNTEDLGLDDLIDLVDEEEPINEKNSIASSLDQSENLFVYRDKKSVNNDEFLEINDSNLEENMNCGKSDVTCVSTKVPDKEIEINDDDDNLELESLMDLVEES